jgi:hypothetical protein
MPEILSNIREMLSEKKIFLKLIINSENSLEINSIAEKLYSDDDSDPLNNKEVPISSDFL